MKPALHHFSDSELRRFRARLLRWYRLHQRLLPWRATRDPYRIWVSEIMLQQTRVGAVLAHYREFLRRFPNVHRLAAARPEQVLAAWSGLGYYRRARALHQAARQVVSEHGGRVPRSARELGALPGIGNYTAAAVASIAFREPAAVLDGNVERVLRRLLDRRHARAPELLAAAEALLSRRRPGQFNQAMMELGATVCLPRAPRCSACPVRELCATDSARGSGAPGALSFARSSGKARATREVAYLLRQRRGRVYLVRRKDSESLMAGMWELPAAPGNCASLAGVGEVEFVLRHAITSTDYRVSVVRQPHGNAALQNGRWVGAEAAGDLPLTGLARKILRRAGVI